MDIKRSTSTIYTIDVDENTVLRQSLQGEDKIVSKFKYGSILTLQIGDYIEYDSKTYTINRLPEIKKNGSSSFDYTISFEGEIYDLNNASFRHEGVSDFSYFGTAEDHINLLVSNANRVGSGWTTGTVTSTEKKLITYSPSTCRQALKTIADEFKFEYQVSGKSIDLIVAIGGTTGLTFTYGKGNGLYSLERRNFDSGNVITRMYGLGSEKNLDYTYGQKRLGFTSEYLEKNVSLYNVIEGEVIFDDIFPQRTGTISGVDASNDFLFTDSAIDFNINDQLLEGTTAKIVFKTGDLSGYTFEIQQYDNTTKEILLIQYSDSTGLVLPNATNQIQVGDTYTIVDIKMPQTYIDTAETELQAATQTELDNQSVPRVLYKLNFDWRKLKTDLQTFNIGDYVTITDTDLGVDQDIRITDLEFPIVSKYKIKSNVSNYVPFTRAEQQILDSAENTTQIELVSITNEELARRNTMRQNQLETLLFDPDGYSDSEVIRPLRVQTSIISIGVRSSNFRLDGVNFDVKYNFDANSFFASAGTLHHREIEIDGVGSSWVISSDYTQTGLTPATSYYLYAKCSKTALNGEWILTDTQEVADQTDYYYFWVGVLYDVVDGYRDFDFVNGKTFIVGDTITSGKLQDITKQNYFDVENGKFNLGTTAKGIDWDVTNSGELTIRGSLFQSGSGSTALIGVFRGVYSGATPYYEGDEVTYSGSSWRYINITSTTGNTPAEDTFWTEVAAKGTDGTDGSDGTNGSDGSDGNYIEYQYAKNGSTTVPPSIVITDLNPSGWSTTPPSVGTLEYLWITRSTKNSTGTILVQNWSTPVRIKGDKGDDGSDGSIGASPVYQGVYDSGTSYYGNATRVDIVQYSGSYYVARSDATSSPFSGQVPTNTSYWNTFGAQFDSVATDLLFASLAYIENLGVKYLQTATSGERIFINGSDGSMRFYDSSNDEILTLDNGTVTAIDAILNGVLLKSSTTGQRIEISNSTNDLKFYDPSSVLRVEVGALIGSYYGIKAGTATFSQDSISIDTSGGIVSCEMSQTGLYARDSVSFPSLPTSETGLSSGDLWRAGNDLRIKE